MKKNILRHPLVLRPDLGNQQPCWSWASDSNQSISCNKSDYRVVQKNGYSV